MQKETTKRNDKKKKKNKQTHTNYTDTLIGCTLIREYYTYFYCPYDVFTEKRITEEQNDGEKLNF